MCWSGWQARLGWAKARLRAVPTVSTALGDRWWARFALPTKLFEASTSRLPGETIASRTPPRVLHMKSALAFAGALAAIAASLPVRGGQLRLDVPAEIGVRRIGELGLVPTRCV